MKRMGFIKLSIMALTIAAVAPSYQLRNGPGAVASIKGLADEADIVAVARSVQADRVGSQATFTLSIDRVLKGSLLPGSAIHVAWTIPAQAGSFYSQLPLVRCLWFLKSNGSGYTLMPTAFGSPTLDDVCMSVPAGDIRARFTYASSLPVSDKLAFEMGASAEAIANGEIKSSLPVLPSSSGASHVVLAAVHRLLAQSTVPRAKAVGYQGLLVQNDSNTIKELELQGPSLTQGNLAIVIAAGIGHYYRNADPAGVASLGRIATQVQGVQQTLPFKAAAARALAWIHTREALPFLAKMLSDPDPDIRTSGVGGLAMFANNEPVRTVSPISVTPRPPVYEPWYRTSETANHSIMSKETLMQREAYYVGFWTKWWQDNQGTIMAGLPPKPQPPTAPPPGATTTKSSSDLNK